MSGGKRRSETSSNQFLSGFTNGVNLFCKFPSVFSLPPPLFFFLFFFYILKRVREREREREDSTIRVTNERTNDAINLLTILKCLISVFRFTWRFCIVATNCSGKKKYTQTHTHLTPKKKKKKLISVEIEMKIIPFHNYRYISVSVSLSHLLSVCLVYRWRKGGPTGRATRKPNGGTTMKRDGLIVEAYSNWEREKVTCVHIARFLRVGLAPGTTPRIRQFPNEEISK